MIGESSGFANRRFLGWRHLLKIGRHARQSRTGIRGLFPMALTKARKVPVIAYGFTRARAGCTKAPNRYRAMDRHHSTVEGP